jgi:hypothetical protein
MSNTASTTARTTRSRDRIVRRFSRNGARYAQVVLFNGMLIDVRLHLTAAGLPMRARHIYADARYQARGVRLALTGSVAL